MKIVYWKKVFTWDFTSSDNCLYGIPRAETYCGWYFIAMILMELKFCFEWQNAKRNLHRVTTALGESVPSYFSTKLGFTLCKSQQPLRGIELQEKEVQKKSKHTGNLFKKNLRMKVSVNSRLKTIRIIVPKKAFYRQRTPGSSCARIELLT